MADFTAIHFEMNINGTASQTWKQADAAAHEIRFSDSSAVSLSTASASWPYVTRPSSGTAGVDYVYVFTADTTGFGIYGGTSSALPPAQFANTQYKMMRINFDNLGTYASAPVFSAYPDNTHGAVSRGDNSLLGGNTTDTGGTARSYLKGQMFGRVDSAGVPAAAPTNAPVVTDGSTGSVGPSAGANWVTNYQGLQGSNDFITFPATPAATTADTISLMIRLFMGANLATGTYANVVTWSYTYV